MMSRKTTIIAIVATIYFLVTGIGLSWVIYEVATAGKALGERVAIIADKNAKEKVYREFLKLVQETEKQRQTLVEYVLREEDTSTFLTNIESIGLSEGVTLVTDSLRVEEKDGGFNSLIIQFTLEGSELALSKMLTIFETLPYHSKVSSLLYTRTEGSQVKGVIGLEVSVLKHEQ